MHIQSNHRMKYPRYFAADSQNCSELHGKFFTDFCYAFLVGQQKYG